jgi:hypothetical protein
MCSAANRHIKLLTEFAPSHVSLPINIAPHGVPAPTSVCAMVVEKNNRTHTKSLCYFATRPRCAFRKTSATQRTSTQPKTPRPRRS